MQFLRQESGPVAAGIPGVCPLRARGPRALDYWPGPGTVKWVRLECFRPPSVQMALEALQSVVKGSVTITAPLPLVRTWIVLLRSLPCSMRRALVMVPPVT